MDRLANGVDVAIGRRYVAGGAVDERWPAGRRVMTGRKRIRGLKFNLVSMVTLTLSYGTFLILSALLPSGACIAPSLWDLSGDVVQLFSEFILDVPRDA